jgi:hypothetical protein
MIGGVFEIGLTILLVVLLVWAVIVWFTHDRSEDVAHMESKRRRTS